MNTKISKLLGIGLTIAVLASLLVTGTPASAGTLSWSTEAGTPTNDATVNQLVSGSDVTDMAVSADGSTIYAVSGTATANYTFKSTNGGVAWSRLTPSGLATLGQPQLVAVAPDDVNYVVVVGDTNKVYFSKDGGATFDQLAASGMSTIQDIDISPIVSGVHNIALAGNSTAAAGPDVIYLNQGASVATWTSMVTDASWLAANFKAGTTINAIEFSPNFASDRVLTAVSVNGTGTVAVLQVASFSSKQWNTGFADYPVTIATSGAITKASIALAPTYLGADSATRVAFIGLSSATNSGLYRVIDTTVTAQLLSSVTPIYSVAFNGSTLVAGAAANNRVYYCSNPTASASAITITDVTQYQRPGGSNGTAYNVILAWAGANVIAGTSGTMSAFSVSKDNGVTFNDISLIDGATAAVLSGISDVAASADGKTVYMSSTDGVNTSVWRYTTAWERVLSLDATAALFILRVAPENAANVYLTQVGGTTMYFSNDSGEKSWSQRVLPATVVPADVAVESAQVLYVLTNGGKVYKSTGSGFTWDDGVTTGLTTGATITSVKANQILVGGTDGSVAWSTDGSASATTWKAMTGAFGSTNPKPSSSSTNALTNNVQLVADKLDAGGFIFATSNKAAPEVFRWTVGTSTAWSDIIVGSIPGGLPGSATNTGTTAATGAMAFGMALNGKVLYVLSWNGTVSFFSRVLDATKAGSTSPTGDWSALAVATPTASSPTQFNMGPQALKFSATAGKFWAVGVGATYRLFSFADTTYNVAPTVSGPADKYVPQTNPVSGKAQDIAFSWARLGSTIVANGYQIDVSLDSGFNQIIFQASPLTAGNTLATTLNDPVVGLVGPDQPAASTKGGQYNFAPDTTYYWRVKAVSPLESLWSTTRSFSFSSLKPFLLSGPAMGTTAVSVNPIMSWTSYTGAKWYELTLSEDPSFAIPEWSHNVYNLFYGVTADETLKFNTTYYWRVRGVTADPYVQGSTVITPAGPYVTGAFTTMSEPVTTSAPAVIISTVTSSAPPTVITVPIVTEKEQPIPSWMLMTIIVIGLVLIIALIILIVRTRRVA